MLERHYQAELIKKLKVRFPGCIVLKNDSGYLQGIPDLIVLWQSYWFVLEVKMNARSPEQPNQRYYVDELNQMSYAAFIYPENEEEIMNEIYATFGTRRKARVPQPK